MQGIQYDMASRKEKSHLNGQPSKWMSPHGVPQGSMLGLILTPISISNLEVKSSLPMFYGDAKGERPSRLPNGKSSKQDRRRIIQVAWNVAAVFN